MKRLSAAIAIAALAAGLAASPASAGKPVKVNKVVMLTWGTSSALS